MILDTGSDHPALRQPRLACPTFCYLLSAEIFCLPTIFLVFLNKYVIIGTDNSDVTF